MYLIRLGLASVRPHAVYTGEKVPDDRRGRRLHVEPCRGDSPLTHAGWRCQRMTATLQRACCATLWLTEPSSQSLMPPVPHAPTTTMSAARDCSINWGATDSELVRELPAQSSYPGRRVAVVGADRAWTKRFSTPTPLSRSFLVLTSPTLIGLSPACKRSGQETGSG
jgi:hypothetical protein